MLCPHVPSSWCSVLLQSCSYHQLSVQNIGWRVHTVSTQHLQHVSRVTCTVGHVPALRDVIVNHCQRCFNWPHALSTEHSPYRHTPCTPQISTRTPGPVELETTEQNISCNNIYHHHRILRREILVRGGPRPRLQSQAMSRSSVCAQEASLSSVHQQHLRHG